MWQRFVYHWLVLFHGRQAADEWWVKKTVEASTAVYGNLGQGRNLGPVIVDETCHFHVDLSRTQYPIDMPTAMASTPNVDTMRISVREVVEAEVLEFRRYVYDRWPSEQSHADEVAAEYEAMKWDRVLRARAEGRDGDADAIREGLIQPWQRLPITN